MATILVGETLRNATQLLEAGENTKAVSMLKKAILNHPDEGSLWELLGIAYWDGGIVDESIDALERAMTLVPLSARGQFALALGYDATKHSKLSTDLLLSLAGRDELPASILETLARALGRANEPSTALHVCQRAAEAFPESSQPLVGIVYYMNRLGASSEQMLPTLFRALHLDPDDFAIRILLASRLHDCGLSEEAAELLRVVEVTTTSCPKCLNVMYDIYLAAGENDLAEECSAALKFVV